MSTKKNTVPFEPAVLHIPEAELPRFYELADEYNRQSMTNSGNAARLALWNFIEGLFPKTDFRADPTWGYEIKSVWSVVLVKAPKAQS